MSRVAWRATLLLVSALDPAEVQQAADILRGARRVLFITGGAVRGALGWSAAP